MIKEHLGFEKLSLIHIYQRTGDVVDIPGFVVCA